VLEGFASWDVIIGGVGLEMSRNQVVGENKTSLL
jgi:hypothetical protein